MKNYFFLLLLFFSLEASSQKPLSSFDTIIIRATFPEGYRDPKIDFRKFSAKATNGKIYTDKKLKNKITFISFWFEHCAPCVAEFEALNDLYTKYKNKKNFQFLSFTFETNENAIRVANEYHLEYPILSLKTDQVKELIFGMGFPTTIITDRDRKIRFIKGGGPREKKEARELVESLFAKEIDLLLDK